MALQEQVCVCVCVCVCILIIIRNDFCQIQFPYIGKTLAAEAIGFETGKPLKIVNYAEVQSKWVTGPFLPTYT